MERGRRRIDRAALRELLGEARREQAHVLYDLRSRIDGLSDAGRLGGVRPPDKSDLVKNDGGPVSLDRTALTDRGRTTL